MKRTAILFCIAAVLALVPAVSGAHGSLDHDVIGAVVLEQTGATASAGGRLIVLANGTEGADGGYVIDQRDLAGPRWITLDCVTSFSYSGHHVATFSGTSGARRYSFQVTDQDGPDNAAEDIRIGVSTEPLDPDACWAPANVSFTLTRSLAGSLDVV